MASGTAATTPDGTADETTDDDGSDAAFDEMAAAATARVSAQDEALETEDDYDPFPTDTDGTATETADAGDSAPGSRRRLIMLGGGGLLAVSMVLGGIFFFLNDDGTVTVADPTSIAEAAAAESQSDEASGTADDGGGATDDAPGQAGDDVDQGSAGNDGYSATIGSTTITVQVETETETGADLAYRMCVTDAVTGEPITGTMVFITIGNDPGGPLASHSNGVTDSDGYVTGTLKVNEGEGTTQLLVSDGVVVLQVTEINISPSTLSEAEPSSDQTTDESPSATPGSDPEGRWEERRVAGRQRGRGCTGSGHQECSSRA